MPEKNALIVQAVLAFAEGCAGAGADDDACEWFFDHYYPWIDTPKGDGKSPQDVWGSYGPTFLDKFREIGKNAAASGGGKIDKSTLETEALAVEKASTCPYCP